MSHPITSTDGPDLDEVFRESVSMSSSWCHCAVGRLAPDIGARIDAAFHAVPLDHRTGEAFHRAVLDGLNDPKLEPLYRLGVAFDEAVDADVDAAVQAELPERAILDDDYPDFVDGLPASAFPRARVVFDAIAALVRSAG